MDTVVVATVLNSRLKAKRPRKSHEIYNYKSIFILYILLGEAEASRSVGITTLFRSVHYFISRSMFLTAAHKTHTEFDF